MYPPSGRRHSSLCRLPPVIALIDPKWNGNSISCIQHVDADIGVYTAWINFSTPTIYFARPINCIWLGLHVTYRSMNHSRTNARLWLAPHCVGWPRRHAAKKVGSDQSQRSTITSLSNISLRRHPRYVATQTRTQI